MSAKPATVSKPRTRLEKAVANSPRAMKARAAAADPARSPPVAARAAVPVTAIELVRFVQLRRAPENVRHLRPDEDVAALADSIAAEGLLQNLIGYRGEDLEAGAGPNTVWIVAGGRRLQSLGLLVDRDLVDVEYEVPVLIRPKSQAIELSLQENLNKRDMNPVDECRAFAALMELGTYSPLDLAKRTGFSERYVKQRLRLADLDDAILDALGKRQITLESATAYAATEDRALQARIFKQQSKSKWEQHSPHRVKADIAAAQATTADPIFAFVGAETYEREGGAYDDDLFSKAETASGARRIKDGSLLHAIAERMIRFQAARIETELADEFPACFEGFVLPPNLRVDGYPWKAPAVPSGMVMVETDHRMNATELWRNIAGLSASFKVIVGINGQGEIKYLREKVFIARDAIAKVKVAAKPSSPTHHTPTAEDIERDRTAKAIDLKQWRLGAGSFAGTPLEGRAFWPAKFWSIDAVEASRDPRFRDGRLVTVQIFVTNAEHDAMREEAKLRVEEDRLAAAERERAAAQAKLEREQLVAQLVTMDPPPAVIAVGADTYYRREDGEWTDDRGQVGETYPGVFPGIASVLDSDLSETVSWYGSIEAFEAALAADVATEGASA